jgi:hypothetical protein
MVGVLPSCCVFFEAYANMIGVGGFNLSLILRVGDVKLY